MRKINATPEDIAVLEKLLTKPFNNLSYEEDDDGDMDDPVIFIIKGEIQKGDEVVRIGFLESEVNGDILNLQVCIESTKETYEVPKPQDKLLYLLYAIKEEAKKKNGYGVTLKEKLKKFL